MVQKRSLVNIDQLAKLSCISIRQLERQFNERIGMPPKLFSRLVRFSHAWIMREKNPNISWLKIAHACDYADQMHMIRDFKEFAGVTPTLLQNDLQKSTLRLQADMTL
jgi:transcriptional regulator GlxA family with amidase domain